MGPCNVFISREFGEITVNCICTSKYMYNKCDNMGVIKPKEVRSAKHILIGCVEWYLFVEKF